MTTQFKGYRIASARMRGWDYGQSTWYFVTIVTKGRARALARIRQGVLERTPAGGIVARCWTRIHALRPDTRLAEWVVMPDHFHGLIRPAGARLEGPGNGPGQPVPPQWRAGTLGVLVNQFKRAVTVEARRQGVPWPGWQQRFHDRIIRDTVTFHAVRRYIAMNQSRYIRAHGTFDHSGPWHDGG